MLLVLRATNGSAQKVKLQGQFGLTNGRFAEEKKKKNLGTVQEKSVTVAQHLVLLYKNKILDIVENPH